jgi:iron-sulfur cluster assembly protein
MVLVARGRPARPRDPATISSNPPMVPLMLALTPAAVEAIRAMIEEGDPRPNGGLRISGSNEGDGEIELEFDLVAAPTAGDEVVREGGAAVFLDPAAAEALAEKTLDVHAHGDHVHFSLED